LKDVKVKEVETSVLITYIYRLPDVAADYIQTFTVDPSGAITVDVQYKNNQYGNSGNSSIWKYNHVAG